MSNYSHSSTHYKTASGLRLPEGYLYVPASGWDDQEHWTGFVVIAPWHNDYQHLNAEITLEMSPDHFSYDKAMKLLELTKADKPTESDKS